MPAVHPAFSYRSQWHLGTGGATDPQMPMGFVQIGPMTNDEGDSADSFLIRMGQTANFGYAPNKRWPNAFMSTGFDLMNPPGTKCISGCIHIFNKQAVAHRLALAARAMIYKEQKLVFSGPRIASAALAGSTLTVKYDTMGTEGAALLCPPRSVLCGLLVCLPASASDHLFESKAWGSSYAAATALNSPQPPRLHKDPSRCCEFRKSSLLFILQ